MAELNLLLCSFNICPSKCSDLFFRPSVLKRTDNQFDAFSHLVQTIKAKLQGDPQKVGILRAIIIRGV